MPKLRENTKLTDSYNSKLNEREASKMVDTATKNNAELKKLKEANIRLKKRIQELNIINSSSDSSSEDEKPKKKTTKKKGQGIMDYLNQF
jgi:translation initiation factor 2B subunit (eIF-2B alpha/beta/delta family)